MLALCIYIYIYIIPGARAGVERLVCVCGVCVLCVDTIQLILCIVGDLEAKVWLLLSTCAPQ